MKTTAKLTALASAISLSLGLVACGGGGGGSSSTSDASGIISSGTITGFGSVYVNGVKFETTRSSFDIEGYSGTQDDLAIGMVVQVNGVINPDGVTGTATSIVFDDELQGSVNDFATDGLTATFTVLGIDVKVDNKTTYFDNDNGGISINTITNGQFVELSGFFDANGTLIASRIENKNGSDEHELVELKGNITNLVDKTFTLKGIEIDANRARLEDLPNGLQEGTYVEVKGSFDGTKIIATEVESEEIEYGDSDEFEIEGFITDYNNLSNFKVNGITVNAGRAKLSPRRIILSNNLQIEVEGQLINGVLQATELKMRGSEVEIQSFVTRVDADNNTFEVTPVTGGTSIVITVGVETEFELEDDRYSPRLTDIRVGDFVEVEGYQNDDGTIFAVEVEVSRPEEVEIQATVDAIQSDKITVLGVDFAIDAGTRFEDVNDNYLTQEQFKNAIRLGQTWIEVKDEDRDGTADKIEIED